MITRNGEMFLLLHQNCKLYLALLTNVSPITVSEHEAIKLTFSNFTARIYCKQLKRALLAKSLSMVLKRPFSAPPAYLTCLLIPCLYFEWSSNLHDCEGSARTPQPTTAAARVSSRIIKAFNCVHAPLHQHANRFLNVLDLQMSSSSQLNFSTLSPSLSLSLSLSQMQGK